jgi:hypothetical protein
MAHVNTVEGAAGNNGVGQPKKIFNSMIYFHADLRLGLKVKYGFSKP